MHNALSDPLDVIGDFPCYSDLTQEGALMCEQAFREALEHGRRRRSAREDFVSGWKEAARQFGHIGVFKRP